MERATDPGGPRSPDAPGRAIPAATERAVFGRDGLLCVYCGVEEADGIDHVWPWAQGGSHDPRNLVPACAVCNSIAGLRVFRDFAAKRHYVRVRRGELGRAVLLAAAERLRAGDPVRVE